MEFRIRNVECGMTGAIAFGREAKPSAVSPDGGAGAGERSTQYGGGERGNAE
jgi:hypothetical protein